MFEPQISAVWTEKTPCSETLCISSWSCDMEGQAKKCVERFCELANRTTHQLHKASTPCMDDHHFEEEEMKSVGELSQVCSQIVLICLYFVSFGLPDILWSVNKLARSITKKDQGLWQAPESIDFHIFILHVNTNNIVMWEILLSKADWDCFKTLTSAGDLEDSKSTSGGTLCIFGSHTFVPISWMCKKQTAVSHSSTESEIISLAAGLRLDGYSRT